MADPRDDRPGRIPLLLGLAGATTAFAAVFRGPRDRFWARMTLTGAGLGSWALLTSRPARRVGIGPWRIVAGLLSALGLYLTFAAGDRFARRYVPTGDADIRDIYALRRLRPRAEIATRLALVIGPAEELFWRGLVQEALMARYGRWTGAASRSGRSESPSRRPPARVRAAPGLRRRWRSGAKGRCGQRSWGRRRCSS